MKSFIPTDWSKKFTEDIHSGELQKYIEVHKLELSENYLSSEEGPIDRITIRKEDILIFQADFKRQLSDDELLIICKSCIRGLNLNKLV